MTRKIAGKNKAASDSSSNVSSIKLEKDQSALSKKNSSLVIQEELNNLNSRYQTFQRKVDSFQRNFILLVVFVLILDIFFVISVIGYSFISSSENAETQSIKLWLQLLDSREKESKKQVGFKIQLIKFRLQQLDLRESEYKKQYDSQIKSIKIQQKQLDLRESEQKKQRDLQIISIKIQQKQLDLREKQTKKQTFLEIQDIKHKSEQSHYKIEDIIRNYQTKTQKNFNFLMSYSKNFEFKVKSDKQIFKNYEIEKSQNTLKKTTDDQYLAYSYLSISKNGIWRIQIKILHTRLKMISIGVFTQAKDTTCGYCQGDNMFYIYAQNGRIYHGSPWSFSKHYLESKFQKIQNGDLVSFFIDVQNQELVWYVNKNYAGTYYLNKSVRQQRLYPFIIMGERGDFIQILNQ